MHDVGRPEQPALVAGAMKPVVAELIAEKEQQPDPPLISEIKNPEAIDEPKIASCMVVALRLTATLPSPMVMLAAESFTS